MSGLGGRPWLKVCARALADWFMKPPWCQEEPDVFYFHGPEQGTKKGSSQGKPITVRSNPTPRDPRRTTAGRRCSTRSPWGELCQFSLGCTPFWDAFNSWTTCLEWPLSLETKALKKKKSSTSRQGSCNLSSFPIKNPKSVLAKVLLKGLR